MGVLLAGYLGPHQRQLLLGLHERQGTHTLVRRRRALIAHPAGTGAGTGHGG